jgi:hypothetical protein
VTDASDDSKTLPQTGPAPRDSPPALRGTIAVEDNTVVSGTYALGPSLGSGGMGEVFVAHDRKIGRDVALKRMRYDAPSRDDVARFVREAQIQARLEHPAIVPVYELGRDRNNLPFFTMKRLSGSTLEAKLVTGGAQQRLLRAFVEVCRAIDFAHARGVVHRDLKPANIGLGEFGEVYVLDWGVARVVGDRAITQADEDTLENSNPGAPPVGTPGYASPEQVAGAPIGPASDVYSLGAVLFEILAGEKLHPRGAAAALASVTASAAVTTPAGRRPDRGVPPELDKLCVAMLARLPAQRPTARACADRIDAYLDGDRDVAHRRALATELVWQARRALEDDHRDDAMRAASRALALDPQAEGAAELVTGMMLQPPATAPAGIVAARREFDRVDISRHARAALPNYLVMAGCLPLIIATGVRSWPTVIAFVAVALALAFAARRLGKHPQRSLAWMVAYAIGNAASLALVGRLAGGLTLLPALVAFYTASLVTYPAFVERAWLLIAIMLVGFVTPFALELTGVVERTWELRPDGVVMHGAAMRLSGLAGVLMIGIGSVMTVLLAGIQSSTIARASRDAQHRLVGQAWHLAQLLPAVAPAATVGARDA